MTPIRTTFVAALLANFIGGWAIAQESTPVNYHISDPLAFDVSAYTAHAIT